MASSTSSGTRPGPLVVIGGAEDPDEDDMRILPRFVELAGAKKARLLVCAAASAEPEESLAAYRRVFETIGVANVTEMSLRSREEANEERWAEAVERATGVFMTGGDQLRLTSRMAGTTFADRMRQRHRDDALVVAGTSAGAAVLGSTMIVRGSGGTVRRTDVEMAPGLGYLDEMVIDTHFDRSGRVHRLLAVLAQNPATLCIGIDEDTAIEVTDRDRFTVLGRGVAMIFDGRVSHLNTPSVEDEEPLALADVKLHTLPAGYAFDLRSKRPVIPEE